MARQPDRVVHYGGAWRYVFRVESRERWYSHLGSPAFVHSMSSGYGANRRDFAHHYYTYDQIGRAIEAYNVRP